jgi:hypothetical protein
VNPRERALRPPFVIDGTFSEPSCGPLVMRFTCDVVIYRWIRRGKPLPDSTLQFVTWEVLASAIHYLSLCQDKRTFYLVHTFRYLLNLNFTHGQVSSIELLRETYREPLGYYLLTLFHLSMVTFSTV